MSEGGTIAGHTFTIDVLGRRVCGCGKLWLQICGATTDDIGKFGFDHWNGVLTAHGYDQIQAEKDRIWRHVTDLASSPGQEPVPEPDEVDEPEDDQAELEFFSL